MHRHLKPDNIFLERNAEKELAKVLDFGVAKALLPGFDTESGATRSGALIGAPHYVSPGRDQNRQKTRARRRRQRAPRATSSKPR